MSTESKLIDTFAVPVGAGLIAGVSFPLIYNVPYSSKFTTGMLKGYNVSVATGLTVTGGSLVGHVAKDWILPYIPNNSFFAEAEGMMLTPVLTGTASALILNSATDGSASSIAKNFLLGAVSEIGSDYINRTFLSKYLTKT